MTMRIRMTTALACLLASGCSSMGYKAQMPDVSANCVDSLPAIAVSGTPLRFPAEGKKPDAKYLEFAQVARCYRSNDGAPRPVALYRLDSITPPAEVDVSVSLSTGGTFAAAVEVLDADFQPVRRYGFSDFVRRGSLYSLTLFLNPSGRAPAYLMLTPDDGQVGKSDTAVGSFTNVVSAPVAATGAVFMYSTGTETRTVSPFLQGGKVLVVARPQSSELPKL
ncbi:hypothetical protein [Lysobacter soli]|uniref:hypothetical protein n=1 Tax=Lysobacter soli TaxID=453783 RepID=UPI00241042B5|nr:hypothetical protein [Lysobacter soli]MDG2519189.1 hypothetical protein [Lysobacter soli]